MYVDILDGNLKPSAQKMGFNQTNWIFQQDNDRKHTAKLTTEYLTAENINVLEWLSQSPDLNPIEHLWAYLERKIPLCDRQDLNTFQSAVFREWNDIPRDYLIKLVDSMPARLEAVIDAKGYHTKY